MAKKDAPLWIRAASEEEIRTVQDMELEIAQIEARRAELMFKKMVITNRCCQREKARSRAAEKRQ